MIFPRSPCPWKGPTPKPPAKSLNTPPRRVSQRTIRSPESLLFGARAARGAPPETGCSASAEPPTGRPQGQNPPDLCRPRRRPRIQVSPMYARRLIQNGCLRRPVKPIPNSAPDHRPPERPRHDPQPADERHQRPAPDVQPRDAPVVSIVDGDEGTHGLCRPVCPQHSRQVVNRDSPEGEQPGPAPEGARA